MQPYTLHDQRGMGTHHWDTSYRFRSTSHHSNPWKELLFRHQEDHWSYHHLVEDSPICPLNWPKGVILWGRMHPWASQTLSLHCLQREHQDEKKWQNERSLLLCPATSLVNVQTWCSEEVRSCSRQRQEDCAGQRWRPWKFRVRGLWITHMRKSPPVPQFT